MRTTYSRVQLMALFRIVEALQPIIARNFKPRGAPMPINRVNWDRDHRQVEVVLPLREFRVGAAHYDELERRLLDMSRISVAFPRWSHLSRRVLTPQGGLCRVAVDRTDRLHCRVHLYFHEELVSHLVNPYNGFTSIPKGAFERLRSACAVRLYLNLCRRADRGIWTVEYWALRRILNVAPDKYPLYKDFRRRILRANVERLQRATDCRFTFCEHRPLRSHTPDRICFYLSNGSLTPRRQRDYNNRMEKIAAFCKYHGVTDSDAQRLLSRIVPRNSRYLYAKAAQLTAFIEEHRVTIRNRAIYFVDSMQSILDAERYDEKRMDE